MDYEYLDEMEKLISGYDELWHLLDEQRNNESDNHYLPVNLLGGMNQQLRDLHCNIATESRLQRVLIENSHKKLSLPMAGA